MALNPTRTKSVKVTLDMGKMSTVANLRAPVDDGDAVPLSELKKVQASIVEESPPASDPGDLTLIFNNQLI